MTTVSNQDLSGLWTPPAHATGDKTRLDRLSQHPPARLAALFAAARAPEALDRLEGDPVCRGLIPGGRLARRWAASAGSPWIGKSFEVVGENQLLGHNRLRPLGGTRALAFTGTVAPSLRDCGRALILRYDDPRLPNPRWTHALHDELREIEPGLLAGPAALRLRRDRLMVLCWFAIDTTADRSTTPATTRGHDRSKATPTRELRRDTAARPHTKSLSERHPVIQAGAGGSSSE
jgi:hypothetical protein